jgi:hypothetical protein
VPVCLREDGKVLTPALQKEFEKVQVDLGSGLPLGGKIHDNGVKAKKAGVLPDNTQEALGFLGRPVEGQCPESICHICARQHMSNFAKHSPVKNAFSCISTRCVVVFNT